MASISNLSDINETEFTVQDHRIILLQSPEFRLRTVLHAIQNARFSIQMFSYMFQSDSVGIEIRDALVHAAQRGCNVQLMIDSFGSSQTNDRFFDNIIASGGRYHRFGSHFGLGYFVRNHQKILIIDSESAIIGGFNVANPYFGKSGNRNWKDFGISIHGPKIAELGDYYEKLAGLVYERDDGRISFWKVRHLIRNWRIASGPVTWLLGGPTNRISPWALALKRDLQNAQQVDLAAAYFAPSQTILRRIAAVADRGGSTRLIMAGKSDNDATIYAARSLYTFLLNRGARIFEFQPLPFHMKLMVIDNACYIGSANLDIRSLFINLEVMLRIENAEFAQALRAIFDDLQAQSEEQTIALIAAKAGWLKKLRWGLSYFLVNSLDYTIGRRIKFSLFRGEKN